MMLRLLTLFCILTGCITCQTATTDTEKTLTTPENPASKGFLVEASDSKAIEIADEAMEAMGGRKAWDNLQYLQWTFFGKRTLLWDKQNQQVRIEYPAKELIISTSLKEVPKGLVWKGGEAITQPDSLQKYLSLGKSIWINDAYWLCMPFKLKDSGVALTYVKEDSIQTGELADVLSLTFEGVGDTPQNKYEVWVDKKSHLITQWAFFGEASQDTANFTTPWANYQMYGDLLLSDDRGEGKLSDIQIMNHIPDSLFEKNTMTLPIQ